jgi:phosphate/sulfate permease
MFDTNPGNPWLIFDNQFIISGKVVGVDTSEYKYCETNYPIFKIDKWSPTHYSANFWSFSKPIFILYFLTLFASTLTSIVLFFVRRPWKSKT